MKAQMKKRWLKALRSGKYAQATDALRGGIYDEESDKYADGYCCLGVLCEISGRGEWTQYDEYLFKLPKDYARSLGIKNGKEVVQLSGSLDVESIDAEEMYKESVGVKFESNGSYGMYGRRIKPNSTHNRKLGLEGTSFVGVRNYFGLTAQQQTKLINMNDTGKSFSDIADWIEKNVKED